MQFTQKKISSFRVTCVSGMEIKQTHTAQYLYCTSKIYSVCNLNELSHIGSMDEGTRLPDNATSCPA